MTYIISEIGINHNGDIELAKELILKSKKSGCDAVKFQKRDIESVYTKEELDTPRESPFGTTTREQKEGIEFSIEQYKELEKFSKEQGLEFIVSCWDKVSLDLVEEHLDVKDIPNFSIIRNPFDKFISGSVYLKRLYGDDCQELFEDENLFYSMLANIPTLDSNFSANWFKPQADFMTDRTHIWNYEDGMGENFVSWLSGIMGVDLEFDEDIEYPKSRDEGNKLKKTPKLIHNLRQLYRKDIELYYPELEA